MAVFPCVLGVAALCVTIGWPVWAMSCASTSTADDLAGDVSTSARGIRIVCALILLVGVVMSFWTDALSPAGWYYRSMLFDVYIAPDTAAMKAEKEAQSNTNGSAGSAAPARYKRDWRWCSDWFGAPEITFERVRQAKLPVTLLMNTTAAVFDGSQDHASFPLCVDPKYNLE